MYKLIALDMDGTLFNSQKKITPRTVEAIKKAKEKGCYVVLASGRPTEGMTPTASQLGLISNNDYMLTYNGSLILNTGSKEIISSAILTGKDAKELCEIAQKLNVNLHAFSTEKGLITPKENEFTLVEATINKINFSLCEFVTLGDDEGILKVMMIDPEDHLNRVIEQLPAYLKEKFSCARSTPEFYEFMNPNGHKGFAIATLAKHLNLSADEIICVGDGGNDQQMIEFAGLGVAMDNAVDEVKAIAQYITTSNDEDGVAKVIEKFMLK